MSEPKIISPLLDGFALGGPMSDHDGICCCPAIKEITEGKYIVKIISVPASQAQMDAFLLAGAYKDPEQAMAYFKRIAEEILEEAALLKDMSRLEGFLAYEGWQMEPITRKRLGYQVYLLADYRRSLEKHVRRTRMTHLEAMNMALDLCSALNVCRQAGVIYTDLKPSNVFLTDKKEFKIGDLGFIRLDALKYTALPKKYHSAYTPAELLDPMESVNTTVDTYALGMILYQLYNEGNLPVIDYDSENPVAAPINADYELSEVILKAIHRDPCSRWQDPGAMGQAIIAYMQRNDVNDVPITPYVPIDVQAQDVRIPQEEEPQSASIQDTTVFPVIRMEEPEPLQPSVEQEVTAEENPPEMSAEEPVEPEKEEVLQIQEEAVPEMIPQIIEEETFVPVEETEETRNELPQQSVQQEDPVQQESAPVSTNVSVSDELTQIFAKADDLIAHETPVGVVLPEIPDAPDPFAFALEDSIEAEDLNTPFDPVMEDQQRKSERKKKAKEEKKRFASAQRKRKIRRIIGTFIFLGFLVALCFAGVWMYQNVYLQDIEGIQLEVGRDQVTVYVQSEADESLLQVTCADNYGNFQTASVNNGKAVFKDLLPDTMYTVSVEIEGRHDLVGQTSEVFTTDTTTNIISFTAVSGPKDGSAVLDFVVDGEEPDEWTITWQAEGEEEQKVTAAGHTHTVSDLSLGKRYTFTLHAGNELSLSGNTSVTFMPSRLILAENLSVSTSTGSDMTIRWKSPGDTVVESWNVRCYNENGYEYTVTVEQTEVYLADIDLTQSYNVEVTASGMTQPARTSITANPIIIEEFLADASANDKLTVDWNFTGKEPEGGWLFMYRIDGHANLNVIKCSEPYAQITPKIPDADYEFSVQAADGTSVFGNVFSYTCPSAPGYNANGVSQENMTAYLLKTPDTDNWTYDRVGSKAFTETFALGDPISVVLHGSTDFYLPGTNIKMLYIFRDAHGNVIPEYTQEVDENWRQIWYAGNYHYGELDLPVTPKSSGTYNLKIYIDGTFVAEVDFQVS